ncbi:MAG: NAD(P)/FAD-dependent oxidoreductase [Nitrospirota bacterium]
MYDVIIIGAGISGLVCGCYLAKAGMKVLISEQHFKPGGYCTTFKRHGFTFDAAAHSFGAYREDGIVKKIFSELEVDKKIKIRKVDPSDIVMAPNYEISFWADLDKTINEFQQAFPDESDNIKNFFMLLINSEPIFLVRLRRWTFKDLLDKYFTNNKLKAILSLPIYGNSGVPPTMLSACMGAQIFIEFLLDGGYHPEGGMRALPDALTERFKIFGGELRLSSSVKTIAVKGNKISGVVFGNGEFVPSKYVVSNCDTRQTFFRLLGRKNVSQDFLNRINSMIPSLSAFVLYLGVHKFNNLPKPGSNVWVLPQYDLNKAYSLVRKGKLNSVGGYLMHLYPDGKSLLSFVPVPFINRKYWINNKEKLMESFIKRIEKDAVPGLSEHIVYKDAATPQTLHKYTLNYKGAAFGWAVTPSQLAIPDLRRPSFIQGLYLTGSWTTQGVGISGVVYVGYDTAKMILKKKTYS